VWFRSCLFARSNPAGGRGRVENSPMAIMAAIDGVGVAVAQLPYVSDALATGRLVTPFPIVRKKYESWYLVYRAVRQDDPALLLFREWLHGEPNSNATSISG